MGYQPRYVQMLWGVREAISGPQSHFQPLPAMESAMVQNDKKCQKMPKSRFGPKIQISKKRPEVSGKVIYGREWVPEVF